MDRQEFKKKQNRIYGEIRENAAQLSSLYKATFHQQGGYILALRHSDEIVEAVEDFNWEVSKVIPVMKYDRCNIHTTMGVYGISDGFCPDQAVLTRMTDIFSGGKGTFEKLEMHYGEYLLDRSALILAGGYDEAFYEACESMITMLSRNGLEFRYPWGTHITVCRFLEDGDDKQVKEIRRLIKEHQKNMKSIPVGVDVGYFMNDGKRFNLCAKIRLKAASL